MAKVIEEKIKIECSEDRVLAGKVYTPSDNIKAAVFIAPATGIKKEFYHWFAQYLAENQYGVITFDNTGIGESLAGHINNCEVSLQSWGEVDMYFVLETLKKRFPDMPYHLIGHSAGGQLVGLMSNSHDLSSMFNVACSSGRLKNMDLSYRMKATFALNIFMPVSNLLFGHAKAQWFGMGEPLPQHVAKQWKEWCNGKGYVKTAFDTTVKEHWYDTLELPSMWINAIDDDIAIDKNVRDMIDVFTKLKSETLTLTPKEHGLKQIGHMKFFSRKSKVLWKLAIDWLDKH